MHESMLHIEKRQTFYARFGKYRRDNWIGMSKKKEMQSNIWWRFAKTDLLTKKIELPESPADLIPYEIIAECGRLFLFFKKI